MHKIKLFSLIISLFILVMPLNIEALAKYEDVVAPISNDTVEEGKINLYLFHGEECPHCEEERKFLESIKNKYNDSVNFIYYEVWHDEDNSKIMNAVKTSLNVKQNGVPFTVIGKDYFIGFSDITKDNIINKIEEYTNGKESKEVDIPLLGKTNIKSVSIPLVAIILGFVDGFNPCAMWILLFLINMLFSVKDKKRRWLLGITFLLISALVYFLSMLGISFILDMAAISWLRTIIALIAIIAGILNIKKFIKEKNKNGCNVVNSSKRKKIFTKIDKFTHEKNIILALLGVIFLAVSVNLIELACSLGFPVVFSEILSINDITGISRIIYLLIYILFYLIDDLVVFIIAMVTLEVTGVSTKYNKIASLIAGILMILMGILLIFKPEWLMFNF